MSEYGRMDRQQLTDLDRYITGNYGEDSLPDDKEVEVAYNVLAADVARAKRAINEVFRNTDVDAYDVFEALVDLRDEIDTDLGALRDDYPDIADELGV